MTMFARIRLALALALALLALHTGGVRAEMLPAARQIVEALNLASEVTQNWEDDQAVPQAWLDAAKAGGRLRINGSWEPKVFQLLTKPFTERYPFVKITYSRGANDTRVVAALVAFGEGRHIADIVTGIDSAINQFKALGALADIGDLPNLRNIPDPMRSADNTWTSVRMRYWCFAYNTNLVPKNRMPARWEDLVGNADLGEGKLSLWRGVSSWLLPLWNVKGEAWATQYIRDLFETVRPHKRKEGAVALVNLVVLGEYNATLAAAEYQVQERIGRGAPAAFHCPDVVPVTSSTVGVLRGNPNIAASRLFLNWLISKEGQLSQYAIEGSPPIHRDLQKLGLMPFPAEVAGKTIAFRNPELLDTDIKAMFRALAPYWEGVGSGE